MYLDKTQMKQYRYGFNGKTNDNEAYSVEGSFQDYGMRVNDTRLARFLSVDPLSKSYPYYTPYQFAGNTPIQAIDIDGREPDYIVDKKGKLTTPVIVLYNQVLGYDMTTMRAVTINKTVTNPKSNAETYSETDVRTDPKADLGGMGWLSTLAHEFKHVDQDKKIGSDFARFIGTISRIYPGYLSKDNIIEQPARDNGGAIMLFDMKYKITDILSNNKLTDQQKIIKILIASEEDKSFYEFQTLKTLQEKLSKTNDNKEMGGLKARISFLEKSVEIHKQKIKKLEKLEKK